MGESVQAGPRVIRVYTRLPASGERERCFQTGAPFRQGEIPRRAAPAELPRCAAFCYDPCQWGRTNYLTVRNEGVP